VSGSGSGGPFERASRRRLKRLLRDPEVKRDPTRLAAVQRELSHRQRQGER
jgi:hypothetical protein